MAAMTDKKRPRPVVLCVLDGWGYREDPADNAVAQANTPVFDRLWAAGPYAFLHASEEDVGLPHGQIGNSEVGMGSISVEPFVFRKPCTNDLVVSREKSFRHAHIHLNEYEMTRRMAEAVGDGFQVASSLLDAFLKTREEPIVDPLETIRKIAEARQFSQKLTDEVVSSYLVEPEANRFGVINAFTNTAQKLGPLQRIEMERFAGTLLEPPLQ